MNLAQKIFKEVTDYIISSFIEIKLRIFAEMGFTVGALSSYLFENAHLHFLDFGMVDLGLPQKFVDGIITGAGSAVGALIIAGFIRLVAKIRLKIKRKKDGKRSTTP